MQGQKDKREGLAEICRQAGVSPEETAYMGDDIPDLCLFPLVALPCAPSDASVLALKKARWVSRFPGGHGAVRELAEFILKSQGLFEQAVMKRFNTEL
jgi:3-deoxy-D-manno-octulosonate 8-phosphate phosphatase (KDO 8-P phosphatase)